MASAIDVAFLPFCHHMSLLLTSPFRLPRRLSILELFESPSRRLVSLSIVSTPLISLMRHGSTRPGFQPFSLVPVFAVPHFPRQSNANLTLVLPNGPSRLSVDPSFVITKRSCAVKAHHSNFPGRLT